VPAQHEKYRGLMGQVEVKTEAKVEVETERNRCRSQVVDEDYPLAWVTGNYIEEGESV
jgi:hypothetical protein